MQFDYLAWLYENGLYGLIVLILLILVVLTWRRFTSDKLASPSFEKVASGIKISDEDEDP